MIKTYCEYLENPLGIDVPAPRLSWLGGRQDAYRICAASTQEGLEAGRYDLWDTGECQGSNACVAYAGKPLATGAYCWWKVIVQDGQSRQESKAAYFSRGICAADAWQADWLGSAVYHQGTSLLLRRAFGVEVVPSRAIAYVSATGFFELYINGERMGEAVLEPPVTNQRKTVPYRAFDVTDALRSGENAIGLMLGRGWNGWPAAILQLQMIEHGGASRWIYTDRDGGWRVKAGPIPDSSIYGGEVYDASRADDGWNRPGYGMDGDWSRPLVMEAPGGEMRMAAIEPIRRIREIKPVAVTRIDENTHVFDFGQNFAGWARLQAKRSKGTPITLKYAELVSPDGRVNQRNLRSAACTDTYLPGREAGPVHYEPRFTYHGFRYVQVEGLREADGLMLTGIQLRNDVRRRGSFTCDDLLLTKLQQNILWTEESNLHGIPTDCPQRDERRGWLNDMTVRAEMALYNFDLAALYTKWIQDIQNDQGSCGAIADTAPYMDFGRRPADPVSSSYIIVPWLVYLFYGDTRILSRFYDGMCAWQAYLAGQTEDGILTYSYYGDWAPPAGQAQSDSIGAGAVSAKTPGSLISTGYFYYNASLLAKVAGVLGKEEDAWHFLQQAEHTARRFHERFYDAKRGCYGDNNQAANAFALYMGLVPPENTQETLAALLQNIADANWHFTTGNLCTRYLLEVLSEHGQIDTAYRLMTQRDYPSYGYMIDHGATTVWERWEHIETGSGCDMASHNHPMYGSVGAWFYRHLAGIQLDERRPGFEHIIIRPMVPSGMKEVSAEMQTPRGQLRVMVRRDASSWSVSLTVPENATATVYVPATDGDRVTRDGMPVGASAVRQAEGMLVFEAVDGTATFTVQREPN